MCEEQKKCLHYYCCSTVQDIHTYFENLCVARCRHDYGLRTSLAKEVKGQISIVTVVLDISAQSRAFISGKSKVHGMVGDLYTEMGGGERGCREKRVGGNTGGCVCVCVYKTCKFWS